MVSFSGLSWIAIAVGFSLVTGATSIIVWVYLHFFYVDHPKIKGIPEIPNGERLSGHLYQLGSDHATTAEAWSLKHGWPVYQFRMGNRRAIMLNSFEAAREWIVKHQSATLDRPRFYTFHGVVSATSAATIGSSPWNERTKKQRRVVGSLTTGPAINKLRPMLDMESCAVVSGIYHDSLKGTTYIRPHIYLKRLALNMMMMFCYGTRFDTVFDPLLHQILADATTIASFRSTNSNPQDFIPYLRYMSDGDRTRTAIKVRERRDKWLASMLDKVRDMLILGESPKRSVAEMLLTDNREGLTQLDIKTILGGLMSGGFETIFSTAIIVIGVLASPAGQLMQQKAYEEVMSIYGTSEKAFEICVSEEKSPYIIALVKEALRFYPPLKLLPPRQTIREFVYQGAVIPKSLLIYINAQAINRDKATYGPDADEFRPERWTEKDYDILPPYHFAFGAGARMCTAVNFSNRALYAIFLRLIVSFKITESKIAPPNTHYVHYKNDPTAANAIPSDFEVKFTPRNDEALSTCFRRSEEMSADVMSGECVESSKR